MPPRETEWYVFQFRSIRQKSILETIFRWQLAKTTVMAFADFKTRNVLQLFITINETSVDRSQSAFVTQSSSNAA